VVRGQPAAFVRAESKPTRSPVVARNVFMNIIVASERLRRGYSLSVNLLLAVIACAIFAGNGEARAASRGARLIVQRAPNFGNDRVVQLWIDRRKVAEIPRDQHYEGFVSGGHHTLSVLSLPNTESRQPTGMGLTLRSGRTYIFTAQWDSVRGTVLTRSTSASDTTAVKMPR
jgi:hypothetical protein